MEPTQDDIARLVADFDKDQTGKIDFHEFLAIMMKKMSQTDQKDALDEAFDLFDKNKDGEISFDDLKLVALELNENMSDEELIEMLEGAAGKKGDGKGKVNRDAFKQCITKANSQE